MNFAPKLKFLNSIWQKILIMFSASETGRGCKWQLLDHRAVNTWRQWGQSTLIVFVFLLCLFVCLFVAFVCLFEKKRLGQPTLITLKKYQGSWTKVLLNEHHSSHSENLSFHFHFVAPLLSIKFIVARGQITLGGDIH